MKRRSRIVSWLAALGVPLAALVLLMNFARVSLGKRLTGLVVLAALTLALYALWRYRDALAQRFEPRRLDRASLLLAAGGYLSMGLFLIPLDPHLAMLAGLVPIGLTLVGLLVAWASIAIRRGTSALNLSALVLNLLPWLAFAGMTYMYSGF